MATYEMQEMSLPNDGGERVFYPRMRLTGQDDLEELARRIAQGTSFTPAEVKAVAQALAGEVARSLAAGRSAKIDGLGIFTPSLGLKEGFGRETGLPGSARRNATAIRVRGVKFRADKGLVAETAAQCRLERSERKFRRSSRAYTPAERLALAKKHLESHPWLSVGEYEAMTGLLHATAARELRRWAAQEGSGIGVSGRGSHRVYVKKQQ